MNYYFSDMHFGHNNIIRFDGRPFTDTEQMREAIINNWNERVKDEDTVYVLGDAFFKGEAASIEIMERLNGHKHLIRGNHDRVRGKLSLHWDAINDYDEIKDGEYQVVLSHYPMMFYNRQHYGAVMLYGHVHNSREWKFVEKWKRELWDEGIPATIINVGCMMEYVNYRPCTLEELLAANPSPVIKQTDDENRGK